MISRIKKVIQEAGNMLKPRMGAVGLVPHAFQPHTRLTSLACFSELAMANTTAMSIASRALIVDGQLVGCQVRESFSYGIIGAMEEIMYPLKCTTNALMNNGSVADVNC